MVIRRGSIWWADLPAPAGSAPGYRRPVMAIQANRFNDSRISTVIVAALTGNLELAKAPGNVLVPKESSGLARDSVVNVSQIMTVDKSGLLEYVGMLDLFTLRRVDDGLRIVLDLRLP